jgi:hypothetical protein
MAPNSHINPGFTPNRTTMEDGSAALSMNNDSNNFQQQSTDRTETWVSTQGSSYKPQQRDAQIQNYQQPSVDETQASVSQPSANQTQTRLSAQGSSYNPQQGDAQASANPTQTLEEHQNYDHYQQQQSADSGQTSQMDSSGCQAWLPKWGMMGREAHLCGVKPTVVDSNYCFSCDRVAKAENH